MKSSLLSVLMFSAVLWPAATFAQTAPDEPTATFRSTCRSIGEGGFNCSATRPRSA